VERTQLSNGIHYLFEVMNRNKRSVGINLREERGMEAMNKLLATTDVFISNFQPPVLARYGLDYKTLTELNPRLIYGVLTGYGEVGPDKDKPGYDYSAFWARSGLMSKIGHPDSPPPTQRSGMGDNITSMCIVSGILAGLFAREKTGRGQEVSFSLYNTAVWALQHDIQMPLVTGKEIPNTDRGKVSNPLWNTYETDDGRWMQLVMVQSDRFWANFCHTLGLTHLEHDPKFESHVKREENNEELITIVSEIMKSKPLKEWEDLFEKNDLVSSRVQNPIEVVNDPQAIENDFFTEFDHPVVGPLKLVASPVKFDRKKPPIRLPAPEVGQHTEEVLLELGYTWEDLVALKDLGAIQ
jgi:crotonobetainyl-CoA:carnitine CoA-transferase CaiB-like acyl-CoA transferase